MKRSIKSEQREVRQLHLIANAAGTALTGLDAKKATMADTATGIKTITLDDAFAAADYSVQVTVHTADVVANVSITNSSTFVITTIDTATGLTDTDAICHITVTGCDIADRY